MRQRFMTCLLVLALTLARVVRAAAQVPPPAVKPNFIVIVLDDARLDDVCDVDPTDGYVPMPKLQALLMSQGVTFENAYACNGLCCPSRACILSGLCSHNNGIYDNDAPKGGIWGFTKKGGIHWNNIGVWMQQGGYATFYGEKYANGYDPAKWTPANGWTVWEAIATPPYPSADYESTVLLPQVLDFIVTTPRSKPFFAFLGMTVPHNPNKPEAKYKGTLASVNFRDLPNFNEADVTDKCVDAQFPQLSALQAGEIATDRQARRECILTADDVIAAIIEFLAAHGLLENTYIILTSDNGFFYGEHRYVVGKNAPYEEAIHMPLIVRGPGVPKDVRIPHLVTLTDIAPTLLDLAGITNPRNPDGDPIDPFDGRSWKPLLRASPVPEFQWRTTIFFEDSGFTGIRFRKGDADFVYITWGGGELYNMKLDPFQMNNILAYAGMADDRVPPEVARLGLNKLPPEYPEIIAEFERIKGCTGSGCW